MCSCVSAFLFTLMGSQYHFTELKYTIFHNNTFPHKFLFLYHYLICSVDINAERRKSLHCLVELRMETIPLIESEEEMLKDQKENHKYLLFKTPSGMYVQQWRMQYVLHSYVLLYCMGCIFLNP